MKLELLQMGAYRSNSRSPCGERGLKSHHVRCAGHDNAQSLPVRGAWIEINRKLDTDKRRIESLPVRGAWIEIPMNTVKISWLSVAPRAGSVD